MDSSSSSKVTVEYHDPSGIFPLVLPSIASYLPLRNLNWQSPSRPLRQIKSLNLDFVPDELTKTSLRPPTAQTDSEASNSFDIVRNDAGGARKDGRERRHQIPGLQTSPYLKIYVLRCDDKDVYKATERGKVRQWIRDNAVASPSNKKGTTHNENHSAAEYLILHVVIPDTIAASEPRWRESQREPDELKERKQGAKWPGKSTRTVFDKLRADFNDSSKIDHVAQLRISKDAVPADLLPTPPQATTYTETAEEQGKTRNDLLTKLKSLILIPFDKRVRQYEQDIVEQESRRSLPGFNFCTFFIHKEGLARAFEAIGLVEDALVVYDELSLGLESVLRDLASGEAEATATTFATYTDDVKDRILRAGKSDMNGTKSHSRADSDALDFGEIDYRDRIVRSNISVFDFQCYLFGRRKTLILRLANALTARKQLGAHTKEGGEDLVLISEVCWRASNFLHNTARVLRQDLLSAKDAGQGDLSNADVDALVCSWLYTVAGQILDETAASALESPSEYGRRDSLKSPPNGLVTSPRRSEFADLGTAYPQRTTSLPSRKSRVSELQNARASVHSVSAETLVSPPSSTGTEEIKTPSQLPGLPELVTYRAELVMMRRKMLEQLAAQRGWLAGWASLRAKRSQMVDVDLNGTLGDQSHDEHASDVDAPSKMTPVELSTQLLSEEVFHESYDRLSDQAMRYYHSATQTKSAEAIVGDLAILKHQHGDYDFAAKYFEHVLPSYRDEGWATMELEAMQILWVCWRELGKDNERVAVLLEIVEKQAAATKSSRASAVDLDTEGLLAEAITTSEKLSKEVSVPADKLFGDVTLRREAEHFDDHNGFALTLSLQHYLHDDVTIDEAVARLVHVDDASQKVCVTSENSFTVRRGQNEVLLVSHITTTGSYYIHSVTMKAKNIHFTRAFELSANAYAAEPDSAVVDHITARPIKPQGKPWTFLYPAQDAFSAEMSQARDVHVDGTRHLDIRISSGRSDIECLDLRLKPASAGLRLHLADAECVDVHRRDGKEAKPGVIAMGSLPRSTEASIKLPYSVDQPNVRELVIHLTAQYNTDFSQTNTFVETVKLPTELPLDVDVNDIFHDDALFSNFSIRATSKSPLLVLSADLQSNKAYDVEAPPTQGTMSVFETHPVNLVYKVTRKPRADGADVKLGRRDASLALTVQYVLVEELFGNMVRVHFLRALKDSHFANFQRLLCPLLVSRVRELASISDIQLAALLGEARLPSYEALGWEAVVNTLPTGVRSGLTVWLEKWHAEHDSLKLDFDAIDVEQRRSITISVEVPTMDFVHRASLRIPEPLYEVEGGSQVLALGEPVGAELVVASSTAWSSASIFGNASTTTAGKEEHFTYDIHTDAESWLVGGPRRGHLSATGGSTSTFEVTLIPLKLGALSLPLVDVQHASIAGGESGTEGKELEVRCETHCASAGQIVRVIKDQRRTRVAIMESAAGAHVRAGSANSAGGPGSRPRTAESAKDAG